MGFRYFAHMSFDPGTLVLICFGITVVIQISYQLIFFSRLAFLRANRGADRGPLPVSVIVCTRDEAENLQKRLPVVLEQDYPAPHEVIPGIGPTTAAGSSAVGPSPAGAAATAACSSWLPAVAGARMAVS